MPVIQINMVEGRTLEQKEELIRKMTDVVIEVLNSPPASIKIMINELKPEHFGSAGETMRARRIREQQEKEQDEKRGK